MPKAKANKPSKSSSRTRHDTRMWILKAFESAPGKEGLLTTDIKRRIVQLSGHKIPDFSVYSALRTLVRRKELISRRRGRQFQFRMAAGTSSGPGASTTAASTAAKMNRTTSRRSRRAPTTETALPAAVVVAAEPAVPATPTGPQVHRLSPGDSVILHVGESHVETATNLHGKIVLERHRRPSK